MTAAKDKAKAKSNRKVIFKRAEQYVKEYRRQRADETRLRRLAKKSGSFYVPAEPKLLFVIRIRGYVISSPAQHGKIYLFFL